MTPATALTGTVKRIAERHTEEGLSEAVAGNMLTSIDNMEPGNKALQALLALDIDPAVKGHSIIAADGDGPLEESDDGIVEYTSAHLDGVASEYVVRFSHSCQACPMTVLEVRRILLEHLDAEPASPQPRPVMPRDTDVPRKDLAPPTPGTPGP
jgi:hypothetical protein